MAKFIIYDPKDGSIIRAIDLPYEGVLVDISAMPDADFQAFHTKISEKTVTLDKDGQLVKDVTSALPVIIDKIKEPKMPSK